MKLQKFNNLVAFLDMLFCITMTYVALFVLSVIQIKQIEVTVDEHQTLQRQFEQAMADKTKIERLREIDLDRFHATTEELAAAQASLLSTQQQFEQQQQMLNRAEQATNTAQERAETLASQVEELNQQVAQLRGVGNWHSNAKIAIEMLWKKASTNDDDIDIYIESPNRHITYFGDQIGPGFFIDRDDLGTAAITEDMHSEVTQFFKLMNAAETPYIVNLHAFKKRTSTPTPVTFRLYQITETEAKVVFEKTYTFTAQDQIEPVVEIFTKPTQEGSKNFIYSHYGETTKKIDRIVQLAETACRNQTPTTRAPVTRTYPETPTTRVVPIRPQDQDPRFQLPPTTIPDRSTTKDN